MLAAGVDVAVAAGKPASPDFGELVRAHQGMVFSIALGCLGDRAAAEDIAQEVFLELYRVRASMESAAHVLHWLRRVATHRSIDEARRRRFRSKSPLESLPEPACAADPGDPLLSSLLRQLVASLPEQARAVVILRFQEELSIAEIAEILEVPQRTVKSRLDRSLLLLREKLARRCGEKTT